MGNEDTQEQTSAQAALIDLFGSLRKEMWIQIEQLQNCQTISDARPSGRAISLAITKLEEARMWLGQALKPLPTGYKQTDVPTDPSSFSKPVES